MNMKLCILDSFFALPEDTAIMKQMHKHQAQVEALRSVFADIDCDFSAMDLFLAFWACGHSFVLFEGLHTTKITKCPFCLKGLFGGSSCSTGWRIIGYPKSQCSEDCVAVCQLYLVVSTVDGCWCGRFLGCMGFSGNALHSSSLFVAFFRCCQV